MKTPLIPVFHAPVRLEGSLLAGVVPVLVWLLLWLGVALAVLAPLGQLVAAQGALGT